LDVNSRLESTEQRWRVERRELKGEVDKATRRIKELEETLVEVKHTQSRVMLGTGTKEIAVKEVSQQNLILNDSIDKLKNELFNIRRTLSQMESEKFDLEKEVLDLRRDNQTYQQQLKLSREDNEHIISLLELKNTLMHSVNYDKPGHLLPLEVFSAMQKLSIFVLNRTNSDSKVKFDEHSQAIVRSVFNENSARMMDHYERRVEA
jgi:chromosome segregation ATPase